LKCDVNILALVAGFGDAIGKPLLGPLNLGTDFGQVGEAQRGTVLRHEGHQVDVVKAELMVLNGEIGRGKIEGLGD